MSDIEEIEKILNDSSKVNLVETEAKPKKKQKTESWYKEEATVEIMPIFDDVILPEYKHDGDACADVRAYRIIEFYNDMGVKLPIPKDFKSITLHQGYKVRIGTGFKVKVQKGYAINIEGRSGSTFDKGIIVSNAPGKADGPYEGEYMVNIIKVTKNPVVIEKNERIAQIEIVPQIRMIGVKINEDNKRGDKGLGSSGTK